MLESMTGTSYKVMVAKCSRQKKLKIHTPPPPPPTHTPCYTVEVDGVLYTIKNE